MAVANPPFAAPRPDSKARLVAYWILTILGPTSFLIGGIVNLSRTPYAVQSLVDLGLPAYFATILGFWKLAGAIVCTVPRLPLLKEWAYAGFAFLLTGAAAVHALAGDGIDKIVPPLFFLLLVGGSYALRPASRRLVPREASA